MVSKAIAHKPPGEVMDTPGVRNLTAKVDAHVVKEFDKVAIGWMLYGFLNEALATSVSALQAYYPPGTVPSPNCPHQANATGQKMCGCSTENANTYAWDAGADEREMGREMARGLGYGLTQTCMTQAQWNAIYPRAMAAIRGMVGGDARVNGFGLPTGDGGFTPPLSYPTTVNSAFGVLRGSEYHRGIDLAASEGSDVRAPWPAIVLDVFNEGPRIGKNTGGLCLKLGLQRPDGEFAENTFLTTGDDTGLVVTFIHLSETLVAKGETVQQGQVIARSGSTGTNADGSAVRPHLHLSTEYVSDTPWWSTDPDIRGWVDPAILWGGTERITGQAVPALPMAAAGTNGVTMDAVVEDEKGRQGKMTVTVTNGGVFQMVGQGAAINAKAKVILPLASGGGDGGYGPPRPSKATQAAASGDIFTGLGSLAGKFFGEIATPAGMAFGVINSVVETVVPVAVAGANFLASLAGPLALGAGVTATVAAPVLTLIAPEGLPAWAILGAGGTAALASVPLISTVTPAVVQQVTSAAQQGAAFLQGIVPLMPNEQPIPGTGLALLTPSNPTGLMVSPTGTVLVIPEPVRQGYVVPTAENPNRSSAMYSPGT